MGRLRKTILGFCVFLIFSSILLVPFGARTVELDSRFGINAFILNRYDWEQWGKPLDLLKDLKVSWTREEFVWSQIEPEKGKFDWGFYDKAFEQLSSSGINVLGIIDYSAPWATEDPKRPGADKYVPDLEAWENFVDKVVERYGRQVKYWQIWNEENIEVFFKPQPNAEEYLKILKSAHKVIKARDKSAKIVLGGTSGVDVGYLDKLKSLKADQYFDILAVHPYRLTFKSAPENNGFMKDLALAEKIAEKFGNKPIWLTEFGWPTDNAEGVDENTQANYLVRAYVMSFTFPDIKKLFWYDFRNDGDSSNYREHNFGIVRRDFSKKKSFYAYRNLINQLERSYFERSLSDGEGGTYDFVFARGNDEIRVIWRTEGEKDLVIEDLTNGEIYNIVGEKIYSSGNKPSNVTISASPSPIFVVSRNKKQNIKDRGNYDYGYVGQSPFLSVKNGEEAELWLKIKNNGTAPWKNSGDHSLLLGTCRGNDRESKFFVKDSWVGNNRPAKLSESLVGPGEIGTFGFKIKPDDNVKEGKYTEYFCPVVEGVAWMKDMGIYWDIEVKKGEQKSEDKSTEKNPEEEYDYEYIEQSGHINISRGGVAELVLKLKNTGIKNWDKGKLNLGTSRKKNRASIFNYNWASSNRIKLDQEVVKPGEVGVFTFQIKAPDKKGVYKEYFQPVLEGVMWLKDIGIYWQITVK